MATNKLSIQVDSQQILPNDNLQQNKPNRFTVHRKEKCEHGKAGGYCMECGGGSLCHHGRSPYTCHTCEGPKICKHGRRNIVCVECKGGGTCQHGKQRWTCVHCKDATIQQGAYDLELPGYQNRQAEGLPHQAVRPLQIEAIHYLPHGEPRTVNENDAAAVLTPLTPSYGRGHPPHPFIPHNTQNPFIMDPNISTIGVNSVGEDLGEQYVQAGGIPLSMQGIENEDRRIMDENVDTPQTDFASLPPPPPENRQNRRIKLKNNLNWHCIHNRVKKYCRICGGSGLCSHSRIPYTCRACGGGGVCAHDLRRSTCRLCKGAAICEHNRQKYTCTLCKVGTSFCEHNKRRVFCGKCGGNGLCPHNKNKGNCRTCRPVYFCEHGRKRTLCLLCRTGGTCLHGRRRINCVYCDDMGICEHGYARPKCRVCQTIPQRDNQLSLTINHDPSDQGHSDRDDRPQEREKNGRRLRKNINGENHLPPLNCATPSSQLSPGSTEDDMSSYGPTRHSLPHAVTQHPGGEGEEVRNRRTSDQTIQVGSGREVCRHGKETRECSKCGDISVCYHGKETRFCKLCTSTCKHRLERSKCMSCRLSFLCEHGRYRHYCKVCHGRGYCIHGKKLTRCRLCGGATRCDHLLIREQCPQCCTFNFCIHENKRMECELCLEFPEIGVEPLILDLTAPLAHTESNAGCVGGRKRKITIIDWMDEDPASEERVLCEYADWQETLSLS